MHCHRPATTHRAFTLIELLVVIAIISILAAILFPVFAQAREKARQTSCLSNMKQINLSAQQYVSDFDETWPIARGLDENGDRSHLEIYPAADELLTTPSPVTRSIWANAMFPYIKNWDVWQCPSGLDWSEFNLPEEELGRVRFSYSMNGYLNIFPDGEIPDPARTISFQEMPKQHSSRRYMYVFPPADQFNGCPTNPYKFCVYGRGLRGMAATQRVSYWNHGKGLNIAYTDGHVKWVSHPKCGANGFAWCRANAQGIGQVNNLKDGPDNFQGQAGFWWLPHGPADKDAPFVGWPEEDEEE